MTPKMIPNSPQKGKYHESTVCTGIPDPQCTLVETLSRGMHEFFRVNLFVLSKEMVLENFLPYDPMLTKTEKSII